MVSLPRIKSSSGDTRLYESLGALIKDFRLWRDMSQESLAASIGISVRALQNWEADRRCARIDNLHDLAEVTGVPMQVCVALNARQPLWYSLRKRRFAYSSIEEALYSSHELLKHYEQSDDRALTKYASITSDKHISMILARHCEIYGTENPLRKEVIKVARALLPDLNRIIFDSWGHYVGHTVCLPIKKSVYEQIKGKKTFEDYLTTGRLSDIVALQEGVFFFYSMFAASANIGYLNYISNVQYFSGIKPKTGYLLAAFVVPVEGKELFENMGMRVVEPCEPKHVDAAPLMYEIELDRLMKPRGPLAALQWLIKKQGRNIGPEKLQGKIGQRELPTISNRLPNNLKYLYKLSAGDIMPVADPLKAVVPLRAADPLPADDLLMIKKRLYFRQSVRKDRVNQDEQERVNVKRQNKLMMAACMNLKCSLYSKAAMGNIIYNGTHRTKEGTMVQRFRCKVCGKSFCSRSRSIFYGLRSPEEKVRQALHLLAKGMSMRGVGRTLGVKTDTIRCWHKAAVKQEDKIRL